MSKEDNNGSLYAVETGDRHRSNPVLTLSVILLMFVLLSGSVLLYLSGLDDNLTGNENEDDDGDRELSLNLIEEPSRITSRSRMKYSGRVSDQEDRDVEGVSVAVRIDGIDDSFRSVSDVKGKFEVFVEIPPVNRTGNLTVEIEADKKGFTSNRMTLDREYVPPPRWTFMIYMSDCDLEKWALSDINELETIGSSELIDIVVQIDRWESISPKDDRTDGNWTTAKRFHIDPDNDPDHIRSEEVGDLGEINSADPEDTDVDVKIGTNDTADGSIALGSGVIVDGDVVVGPGGDVNSVIDDQGATTGDRYAITTETEFPEVTAPTLFDMGGVISAHGTTIKKWPADSGEYDGISLKNAADPAVLEIDGGEVVLYITGDISLGQDCEIVIKEGASLVLYLDGDLSTDNDSGINNLNDPENFKLYGTGEEQTIDLKAKGDFHGAVYAPNADVAIYSGGDIYGSFVTSSFEMKSNSNFYYDEALLDAGLDDEAVRFVVIHWSE